MNKSDENVVAAGKLNQSELYNVLPESFDCLQFKASSIFALPIT